jgi:anti-anti-sigma regulatory factor
MLNRQVQAANGRLALCRLTSAVLQTLESTRLTELFTICANRAGRLAVLLVTAIRTNRPVAISTIHCH